MVRDHCQSTRLGIREKERGGDLINLSQACNLVAVREIFAFDCFVCTSNVDSSPIIPSSLYSLFNLFVNTGMPSTIVFSFSPS